MCIRYKRKSYLGMVAALCVLFLNISCKRKEEPTAWLDDLHKQGRKLFYQTIRDEIAVHPKRSLLTDKERAKISEAEKRYDGLYELLINIFYQKDAIIFQRYLEAGDEDAKSDFNYIYLDLVQFSARKFLECFFATDSTTGYIRKNFKKYKDMDAVDLVMRSLGYYARLDIPETAMFANPLSPEFNRQRALDAARFREAHKITRGEGAKIAILDTGIDESHSIFKNTKWGKHFSLVGREGKPWETDAPLVDWGDHGTLIASVAARYAPEAQITMYKFADGDTQNDPPYQLLMQCMVAAAIYRAVHDGNDVICISASGSSLDSDYLRKACEYAYIKNRVVISGGLYSRWFKLGNVYNFPAQYETVIAVTAAKKRDDGTYGYWDVCAPHKTNDVSVPNEIFGAFPTYVDKKDAYVPSISAAIPVVGALCALAISEYPRLGNEEAGKYADAVMGLIIANANPYRVGFEGFSPECGFGLIDAEKTVKNAVLLNKRRQRAMKR